MRRTSSGAGRAPTAKEAVMLALLLVALLALVLFGVGFTVPLFGGSP